MKQNKRKTANRSAKAGILFGTVTFVALSLLAGSITQISSEVGVVTWALDFLAYTLLNKLFYKLVVSLMVGGFVTFAVNMAEYGKAIKHNKVSPVRFEQQPEDAANTRIA